MDFSRFLLALPLNHNDSRQNQHSAQNSRIMDAGTSPGPGGKPECGEQDISKADFGVRPCSGQENAHKNQDNSGDSLSGHVFFASSHSLLNQLSALHPQHHIGCLRNGGIMGDDDHGFSLLMGKGF